MEMIGIVHIKSEGNEEWGRIDLVNGGLIFYGATQRQADYLKQFMERFFIRRKKWTSEYFIENIVQAYRASYSYAYVMENSESLPFFAKGTRNLLEKVRKMSEPLCEAEKIKFDLFEQSMEALGKSWFDCHSRPQPKQEDINYWHDLVNDWKQDQTLPLLVQSLGPRGLRLTHTQSGRAMVICDSSPAHWSFMGCLTGQKPTLVDVMQQLRSGELPLMKTTLDPKMGVTERATLSHNGAYTGVLAKSKYGNATMKGAFPGNAKYKLCLRYSNYINCKFVENSGIEEFSESGIKYNMSMFLDPSNMILVPKQYSELSKCQAFLSGCQ